MSFQRRFPKDKPGSPYPAWEEVILTKEEETIIEQEQRTYNKELMKECLNDAKTIVKELSLKDFQTDITSIAIALFEKRASHLVYWKEESAKKKID